MLALHVCGDEFSDEEKLRDFDYYEALTVRDSSLSACTQSVVAAEVGHLGLAYDYLVEAAQMDLRDLEHNTRDGVHIASLAGTWIALVAGFGGMRDHDGELTFAPRLPAALTRLAFGVLVRGRTLRVEVGARRGHLLGGRRRRARHRPPWRGPRRRARPAGQPSRSRRPPSAPPPPSPPGASPAAAARSPRARPAGGSGS